MTAEEARLVRARDRLRDTLRMVGSGDFSAAADVTEAVEELADATFDVRWNERHSTLND